MKSCDRHIALGIRDLSRESPRTARKVAAAIMRASPCSNTPMVAVGTSLLKADDDFTEREFAATFEAYVALAMPFTFSHKLTHWLPRYKKKPTDDEGQVPDNIDFLAANKAFRAFVQSSIDLAQAPKPLEDVTDELIGMAEDQRFRLVQDIIDGNKGWQYEAAALPLGCLLK